MHSEAATIGEIVHPVAGSTARGTVAIVVVGAVVGSGTRRQRYDFSSVVCAKPLRQKPFQMEEAAGIAAELDLVEQLSAANAPLLLPAARQIVEEIVGRAGFWRRSASLRRRAELQPLPDAARTEPGLSGDVADEGSSLTQSMDLIKDEAALERRCQPGQVSMRRCVASTTRTTCDRRWVFIVGSRATELDPLIGRRGSAGSRSFRASSAGDGIGQRLALRAGRTLARALRIQAAAIAADDFDLGMLPKPFGCPGGCAILQHVDDLAPLEVQR